MGQEQQWKGYWESDFWKKCLKQGADSTGMHVHHYGNGEIKHEGHFEEGQPAGTWVHYDFDGKSTAESEFNGKYQYWHKGCLSRTGTYAAGRRTGIWREFYYLDYTSCDSIVYHNEYDFEKQIETWSDYKYPGSVEKQFVAPWHFNRDLDYDPHRFTDLQFGIQRMDYSLLNGSLMGKSHGFSQAQYFAGISQTFLFPTITDKELRLEYHHFFPETVEVSDSLSFHLSNYRLSGTIGANILKHRFYGIYPFFGLAFGMSQIERQETSFDTRHYYRPSMLMNLMVEQRLNIRPDYWRKGVSIGVKTGYIVDVAGKWSTREQKLPSMYNTGMSGFYLAMVIGLLY